MAQVQPISPLNIPAEQVTPPPPVVPPVQTDPLAQATPPQVTPQSPLQAAPQAASVPATPSLDPATGTVEGRVASITAQGGPLQRVGETKALQQANQRGLLNTSMAVGAAQKANIESALPIAQQDAAFYQQEALQNQKADLDKQLLTASADEQVRLILEKGKVDTALQELRGTQETGQIRTAGEVEAGLMSQKAEIDKQLLTASGDVQASLMAQQGVIDGQLIDIRHKNTQELMLSQEAMESRLADQRAEISKQLLTAEGSQKEALLAQQGQLDFNLAIERGRIASDLQQELFAVNSQLETMRAGFQATDLATRQQHELQLTTIQSNLEKELQGLIGSQALQQQGMHDANVMEMAKIEKEYDVLINSQHAAASVLAETSNSIGAILANPDIPTGAKPGLISQQMQLLNSSLSVMGGIADMDIGGLLNFSSSSFTPQALTSTSSTSSNDFYFNNPINGDPSLTYNSSVDTGPVPFRTPYTDMMASNPDLKLPAYNTNGESITWTPSGPVLTSSL